MAFRHIFRHHIDHVSVLALYNSVTVTHPYSVGSLASITIGALGPIQNLVFGGLVGDSTGDFSQNFLPRHSDVMQDSWETLLQQEINC